jgi:hypothetical protein
MAKELKCKGCGDAIMVTLGPQAPGTIQYGYCSYSCMEEHKPEAFGGDPNALIPEPESPAAFHRRKMDELK